MRLVSVLATALVMATIASGCNQQTPAAGATDPRINQSALCEVSGWQHDVVAGACKPGQKVVFLPGSWGNEQLPVIFAAVNCDLRYNVAMTTGAVTCIYSPIEPTPASTPAPPKPTK